MLSNLESPQSQPDSFSQMVFSFIRETDRFINAVGQRATTIRSRTDENAGDIVVRISESRIASKQLSMSLANLNRLMTDASFQNAILGIQRALNEIIWKFSGIRKYCLGLKMKGQPLPAKNPLNHMVNQLDGEIYRAVRKITDSLELASERYYGLERIQDEQIDLYSLEKELTQFEYFEPNHEATFILLEAQKYQIRDILNQYGIDTRPVVKRKKYVAYQAGEHAAQANHQRGERNTVDRGVEAKIDRIEQELSRSVVALQSRIDEMNANLRSRSASNQNVEKIVDERIREYTQSDENKREETRAVYQQIQQLMEINERLQYRIEQAEEKVDENLRPLREKIEMNQKNQDMITGQIEKILVIMNEKYSFLESKIPSSNGMLTTQQLQPELERIFKNINEGNQRMKELSIRVSEIESKQDRMSKNLNERFNNVILMLREEMHIISKNKVDKMIRKFIDYMKGTNGEHVSN